jgi:holdfast attachment protein HfaA
MARQSAWSRGLGVRIPCAAIALSAAFAVHGASAQTMSANSASFNAGFGRTAGEENRPVNVALTDGSGNTTLSNGLIQPVAGSLFAEVPGAVGSPVPTANTTTTGGASGAGDSFSGAGGGGSVSAIGNSLNVIVQGDNNTVIVNATQINNGAVTATSTTSGK